MPSATPHMKPHIPQLTDEYYWSPVVLLAWRIEIVLTKINCYRYSISETSWITVGGNGGEKGLLVLINGSFGLTPGVMY